MFSYRIFKLEYDGWEALIYKDGELFEQPSMISDTKENVESIAQKICFNLSMVFSFCGHEVNLKPYEEYTKLDDKDIY